MSSFARVVAVVGAVVALVALGEFGGVLRTSSRDRSAADGPCGATSPLAVDLGGGVRMQFVLVMPGEFSMGSTSGDFDEVPPHSVRISRPYYLGVTEVSQAQWKAIMDFNPSKIVGDDLPVESVSWDAAQLFLARLSAKEGGAAFALPTEAQWEFACRAGTTTAFTSGDAAADVRAYAWFGSYSAGVTFPAGMKAPNAWGLRDMHGNVWEWCEDRWHRNYFGAPADGSAWSGGPPEPGDDDEYRVIRGGGWFSDAENIRSASRGRGIAGTGYGNTGFRVARAVPEFAVLAPAVSSPVSSPSAPRAEPGGSRR